MKLNTYIGSGTRAGFITLLMSTSIFASDLSNEGTHITVGSRSVESSSEDLSTKQARIALKFSQGEDLSDEVISDAEKQALISRTSEESETAEPIIPTSEREDGSEKVAKAKRTTYYTSHSGAMHTPIGISYLGEFVELEDGSFWSVQDGDRYKTLNWLTGDTLIIKRNTDWFKSCKYKIVNITTGVEVRVNLYLGPVYNGAYTNWIAAVDTMNGNMLLSDGSLWKLSIVESSEYSTWLFNDTIIIGINDGWFMGTYPNLLINVNTNNDTIGNCI